MKISNLRSALRQAHYWFKGYPLYRLREELVDASIHDELLVVRPPKRVLGGVTVRF